MEDLLEILGTATILVGAVAWVVRSLAAHVLSRDVESFKERLRAESEAELERLRHSLRMIAAEHEKRAEILHQRRAEVIAELYSRLKRFVNAAGSFASYAEWKGEPSKEEKAAILGDKAAQFHEYYSENRIFFSENVCQKVDAVWEKVHSVSVRYRVRLAYAKDGDGRADSRVDEAWDEAWSAMKDEVPALVRAVEDEFRALLGVADDEGRSANNSMQPTAESGG